MSTLKVDNIQHTNGTDAMTIDSDGSVQLKKYVTGSYAASSTWTPGANVVPSWALDVTMVFTEVSHVTQGDEAGPQVYVGGSPAPSGSYNYVWWYMGNGAAINLTDARTAGHTWLRAIGFTNPNNIPIFEVEISLIVYHIRFSRSISDRTQKNIPFFRRSSKTFQFFEPFMRNKKIIIFEGT